MATARMTYHASSRSRQIPVAKQGFMAIVPPEPEPGYRDVRLSGSVSYRRRLAGTARIDRRVGGMRTGGRVVEGARLESV